MPVHLYPARPSTLRRGTSVSRRGFLGSLAAAATSPAWISPALAVATTPTAEPGEWFALLSDIHIAADEKAVLHEQVMAENLRTAVAQILAHATRPAAVFITGDLALANGQTGDYETLVRLLAPLCEAGVPLHLALGNHDNRTHFRSILQVEAPGISDVSDRHVSVTPGAGHRFIVLDSLDKLDAVPGRLGDGQRGWLGRILDDEPRTPVILLVHHNPTPDDANLTDAQAFLELIRTRRQVKAVIYGHTHRWEQLSAPDDVHLVNLPAVAYHFDEKQPLGWVRLTLSDAGAQMTLHTIGGNRNASNPALKLSWRSL